PILILGVLTYLIGLSRNQWACLFGILVSVAALVFYKYTRFVCVDLLSSVWQHGGHEAFKQLGPWVPEAPPLAISFFVFEFVHSLYDVRRGADPIKSPLNFGLFSICWPSIVAGPVKRYQEFVPALWEGLKTVSSRDVALGFVLIAVGLVKKFAADT